MTGLQRDLLTAAVATVKPGDPGVLSDALPRFERIMIQAALKQTGGRKRDASILLGWGRNTLTRKIADLGPRPLDDLLVGID